MADKLASSALSKISLSRGSSSFRDGFEEIIPYPFASWSAFVGHLAMKHDDSRARIGVTNSKSCQLDVNLDVVCQLLLAAFSGGLLFAKQFGIGFSPILGLIDILANLRHVFAIRAISTTRHFPSDERQATSSRGPSWRRKG
jgi:hypothetical protein